MYLIHGLVENTSPGPSYPRKCDHHPEIDQLGVARCLHASSHTSLPIGLTPTSFEEFRGHQWGTHRQTVESVEDSNVQRLGYPNRPATKRSETYLSYDPQPLTPEYNAYIHFHFDTQGLSEGSYTIYRENYEESTY